LVFLCRLRRASADPAAMTEVPVRAAVRIESK